MEALLATIRIDGGGMRQLLKAVLRVDGGGCCK